MDRSAAQAEALRMLAAEKVEVEDLVKDAVSRDQALDAYEDSIARTREQRIRSLEDQRKRIEQQIVAEENRWLEWRKQKRRRERELAYAVGYLIDRPVITTDEE
jgi:septal ring factor EnvC (AmiA/AmiB activator)